MRKTFLPGNIVVLPFMTGAAMAAEKCPHLSFGDAFARQEKDEG
jgi:hypothetical protein